MTNSSLPNLRTFGKLCGDDNLQNVFLATAKTPRNQVTGSNLRQELAIQWFGRFVAFGARVAASALSAGTMAPTALVC